jgi:hypothetical protein
MDSSSIRRVPRCWSAAEAARPDSTARRGAPSHRDRSYPRASLNPPPPIPASRDKTPRRSRVPTRRTDRHGARQDSIHPARPRRQDVRAHAAPRPVSTPRPAAIFPQPWSLLAPKSPRSYRFRSPVLQVQTPRYVAPKNASAPETLLIPPRQKLTPRSNLYRRGSRRLPFMLQCSMARRQAQVSRFFIFRVNLELPTGFSRPGRGEQDPARHHMPKQGGPIFGAIAGYTQRHGSVPTARP